MKVELKLLQDYGDYKKGDTVTADEAGAKSLIDEGIAEKFVPLIPVEALEAATTKAVDAIVEKLIKENKIPSLAMVEDEADKPVYKTAGRFYRDVMRKGCGEETEDFKAYLGKAPSGANTLIDSEGGFLVPEEFSLQLLAAVDKKAQLAPRTTQIPINRMIKLPALNHYDESTSWAGGVITYWVAEGEAITPSQPNFDQVRLELNKLAALMYVTSELMDDSPQAIEVMINTLAATAIARHFDEEIINGTGAGTPLGILNSPAVISVAIEADQAAKTFNLKNALKMWARINDRGTAIWLMNRDVTEQVMQFSQVVGTGGAPVVVVNATTKLPEQIFGAPIIESDHCQTLGTVGDIILTNMDAYLTATKAGADTIKSASSIHVKFTTDQTALRFIYRADGKPWWKTAMTRKHAAAGATISPYVTLAVRE
jgi:HK97 family phage major capsid protein